MSQIGKKPEEAGTEPMNFEQALTRLENIVESMESGELPLETMLERFEEGSKMVKVCQTKLAEAELKVQKLEKSPSGELTVKPFETP